MLIGIDLGTTNSAVAIWRDGVAELIPNALGDLLTPSAVSIDRQRQTWVGAAALDRMANHPDDTATSFKRLMGTDKLTRLGGKDYRAEDLSALVLMALRDDVAKHTGTAPTQAVITVPAYFNDRQRKATRRSGQIAGLDVRRLINELRLAEMKVAQRAGPSQCRAFVQTALLDPDKAVLPDALRRREQVLAVELADAGKLAPI
jgi:molecular chaperone HscC